MSLFSQRHGHQPAKAVQRESVDGELKNRIWNCLDLCVWTNGRLRAPQRKHQAFELLLVRIWIHFMKCPLDQFPMESAIQLDLSRGMKYIRQYYFDNAAKWWRIYDFVEFTIENIPDEWYPSLKDSMNCVLAEESSAYRIIENRVTPIVDEVEIDAVESALSAGLRSVRSHIAGALSHLSDRQAPDFRASIKESISAVEAACQSFSGEPKATLSDCLKIIKKEKKFHAAFEGALSKLYAYTSDDGGIRHALGVGAEMPSRSEAQFMLVACSAFVNYILARSVELNIQLGGADEA